MKCLITFCFLLVIKLTVALYDDNDNVTEITKDNFDQLVFKSDNVWLVHFYSQSCIASTDLSGEVKKAASALKGAVRVGSIDADQHRVIARRFDVTDVPTIMVFSDEYSFPYFEERSARAFTEIGLAEVMNKVKAQLKSATSTVSVIKKKLNPPNENVL